MLLQYHTMVVDHQKEEEFNLKRYKEILERGVKSLWQDIKTNNAPLIYKQDFCMYTIIFYNLRIRIDAVLLCMNILLLHGFHLFYCRFFRGFRHNRQCLHKHTHNVLHFFVYTTARNRID